VVARDSRLIIPISTSSFAFAPLLNYLLVMLHGPLFNMLSAALLTIPLLVGQVFATPTPSPEALEHAAKILQARQEAPPGGAQEGRFTFYQMPTPLSGICDLAVGPDGALWGIEQLVNNLVRLDPESGEVEEFPIPFSLGVSNATIPGKLA
jgi:streptogramin lyase